MKNMAPDGQGRLRLEYIIAARGLIGFPVSVSHDDFRNRHHESRLIITDPSSRAIWGTGLMAS